MRPARCLWAHSPCCSDDVADETSRAYPQMSGQTARGRETGGGMPAWRASEAELFGDRMVHRVISNAPSVLATACAQPPRSRVSSTERSLACRRTSGLMAYTTPLLLLARLRHATAARGVHTSALCAAARSSASEAEDAHRAPWEATPPAPPLAARDEFVDGASPVVRVYSSHPYMCCTRFLSLTSSVPCALPLCRRQTNCLLSRQPPGRLHASDARLRCLGIACRST